jgi:hypothetical protein
MRAYFLIFLCYVSATTYAQQLDTGNYKLIYSEIRSLQDSGIVFYSDRPEEDIYASFLKQLPDALITLKDRGLYLSKREMDTIIKQLKLVSKSLQPIDLFPLSKRISSDSIIPFVENSVKKIIDSLKTLPEKAVTSRFYWKLPWAFFFTNPIYIRGWTICFSYFMYYRNSAGEHGLRVYKMQNDKWVRIGTIGGGAW